MRRKGTEKGRRKEEEKPKKEMTINVKRVAKEWKIWDKEKEAAKSEKEVKKLVPKRFYK